MCLANGTSLGHQNFHPRLFHTTHTLCTTSRDCHKAWHKSVLQLILVCSPMDCTWHFWHVGRYGKRLIHFLQEVHRSARVDPFPPQAMLATTNNVRRLNAQIDSNVEILVSQ